LVVVIVGNIAIQHITRTGTIFRDYARNHKFGKLELPSVCQFETIGIVIVSSAGKSLRVIIFSSI
jgi:hypothetical protein